VLAKLKLLAITECVVKSPRWRLIRLALSLPLAAPAKLATVPAKLTAASVKRASAVKLTAAPVKLASAGKLTTASAELAERATHLTARDTIAAVLPAIATVLCAQR